MRNHGLAFRTVRDVVAVIGTLSMIVGMYMAWEPLAWVAGGAAAIGVAVASYWMEPENDETED